MMRSLRKLVTLLVTFVLGAAALIAFDFLTPDLDVLELNHPTKASVSITFIGSSQDR